MGQSTEQFLALYNMTSFFFDEDPGLARRLVRMAFHDAMGGVDAHLDLTNSEHDGLERTFSFLNRLWRTNKMRSMGNETDWSHGKHKGNRTDFDKTRYNRTEMGEMGMNGQAGDRGGNGRGQGGQGQGNRGQGNGGGGGGGGGGQGQREGGDGQGRGGRGMGGNMFEGEGGGGGRGMGGMGSNMFGGGGRGGSGGMRNNTDFMMGMGRNFTRGDGRDRNNDLMMLMRELDPVSVEGLTKADFFSWMYIAAFYHSCRRHVPWVPLRFGRTTFEEAQVEDTPPKSEFGSGDHASVLAYFEDHFGFNEGQVAVLMGAHTLGGSERRSSGFVGDWTSSPGVFNNEYYENLMFPGGRGGWEQVAVANDTKFEWRWGCNNRCRDLMLNVDMNLFYNLDDYFVGESGQVQLPDPLPATAPPALCSDPDHVFAVCFPERAGASQTIVSLFEDGNGEMFLDNFAMVFGDMVSRVKDDTSLGYVAPPSDWPMAIRMGRGGRGGRGGRDGRPGRGRPGRGPRGCGMDNIPDAIGLDGEIDDLDESEGFDMEFDEENDFDEVFETGEVGISRGDATENENAEDVPVATTKSASEGSDIGGPFTRRLRASA